MGPGPFLSRELATSARSSRAFSERRIAAILAGATVLGACLGWDWNDWDRSSILGAHRFGLAVFGMMVFGMIILAFGVVVQQVAGAIASERDRKSLDALLASRFSSFEIVLGAVATGLFRYANVLAASVPVVVLMVYLGGVAPIWAVLAVVGLASTACLLAGFSVVASVEARTRARAVVVAMAMFAAWLALPTLYLVIFRPFVWSGAPEWLTTVAVAVLDSSPMGLLSNLLGVMPRPGGPIGAVGRMAAWQLAWTLALVAWATVRLRPASRGLYDVEGERGRIKRLKAALRRPPRRPPCSDDPVFWCEAYSSRAKGLFEKLAGRAINLALIAGVAVGTWWFAGPAFAELAARGYGASPEGFAPLEMNPVLRLIIKARLPALSSNSPPGQARMEFNVVLRMLTASMILWLTATIFSLAFESIKGERRRDTWIGLLATPLTPREILRGKALGALWKLRWAAFTLVAPLTVGLLAGAVHPLGYLATLAFLAALGLFYADLGLLMALQEWDPEKQGKSSASLIYLPILLVGSALLTAGPIALAWASLLTYEDIDAAIRSGPLPEFGEAHIGNWMGARGVMLSLLGGTGALALGTIWLRRRNERGFDKSVGRPVRMGRPVEGSGRLGS
jgi:ABC-type transport system involved in multi-copper enzyme maturation permease subunit